MREFDGYGRQVMGVIGGVLRALCYQCVEWREKWVAWSGVLHITLAGPMTIARECSRQLALRSIRQQLICTLLMHIEQVRSPKEEVRDVLIFSFHQSTIRFHFCWPLTLTQALTCKVLQVLRRFMFGMSQHLECGSARTVCSSSFVG